MFTNYDDFDTNIQPEEFFEEPISWEDIEDDNPIEEDFEPDFDLSMEYEDMDYPEDDYEML